MMDDQALLRYSRQIMLPEVDIEGQERLQSAHAVIIGAGGLGSPAALYLAAAGVGRITIADADHVELSNLQRQIAHQHASIGLNKAHSAQASMQALNPHCHVVALDQHVEGEPLERLIASADVVLDCTDRFSSRYAVNAASQKAGVPLVSGAAIRFSGQLAIFDPRNTECPCYACLYPPDESGDEALSCSESGVMAPLVGLIGCFQAVEAFKLLSGAGSAHQGLSTFDGLSGQWRHFQVPRDPACPVCAQRR
ncbi:HesA/MoeB/ThiF family protein [Vreelandella neptunia]|uniref:Molybdopterin-synthase adenylyltransferase MoeB n=1 Tax=Vreelandella neptunia TaxID=115551 RepID=A0ABZ0YGK3_9GAMM|nr:molybdopterin-synthase adenylyltransferase MoeB [Halomonas neptunia]MDN3561097.1 molybdopterin-synthase adenylyltransferase MoeB [Halomonas neptunia]TDW00301.1 adenylyltransferase/sulfurtransferase [Halomonas alkaliantarctica]WQH11233.1 molybdopterin-synthase adenylyltransferase MoeB [Halomonas neptunia]